MAGTALKVSGDGLLATTSLLLLIVLWRVNAALARGARRVGWLALVSGTSLGWALWMLLVGPLLLP